MIRKPKAMPLPMARAVYRIGRLVFLLTPVIASLFN
jgi:hypothetical protein